MKRILETRSAFYALVTILTFCLQAGPCSLFAQTQGNNGVYAGTNPALTVGSTAYIDASAVNGTSSNTDVCAKINAALGWITSNPASAVIDARGISGSSNLTCPSGTTPWVYSTTTRTTPATILLPAGTITISTTWVIPNKTRVIGEGAGAVGTSATAVTSIQTSSALNPMIQMGISAGSLACPTGGCTGISIEDLVLNGEGVAALGISNNNAHEQSYVKRVALYQFIGAGLKVLGGGSYSGPYTDITFGTGAFSATTTTICAAINAVSTRGIHGLTCTNTGATPTTGGAVLLGGSNNSLEDVTIQGFFDGVKIGSNGIAQGDVLLNIAAAPWTSTPSVSNAVVHVVTANAVSDVAIMGVNKGGGTGTATPYTIQDDVTAPTPKLMDVSVGMYAIGESATVTNATKAYSRFTTSPNIPTWVQGASAPSGSCAIGSLYSNTGGTNLNNDLYVCTSTGWSGVK